MILFTFISMMKKDKVFCRQGMIFCFAGNTDINMKSIIVAEMELKNEAFIFYGSLL